MSGVVAGSLVFETCAVWALRRHPDVRRLGALSFERGQRRLSLERFLVRWPGSWGVSVSRLPSPWTTRALNAIGSRVAVVAARAER